MTLTILLDVKNLIYSNRFKIKGWINYFQINKTIIIILQSLISNTRSLGEAILLCTLSVRPYVRQSARTYAHGEVRITQLLLKVDH